jgi:hypothetical protein
MTRLKTPTAAQAAKILDRYNSVERERLTVAARSARKLLQRKAPVRTVLHRLFDFQRSGPDQAALFGSPAAAIQLGSCTAVQLLLETTPGASGYEGLSFGQLRDHAKAGKVRLIMREPSQYRNSLTTCALIKEFHPVNYFWRTNLFYSLLSGGDTHVTFVKNKYPFSGPTVRWFSNAWDSDLTNAALSLQETWEPEHQRRFPKLRSWLLREEAVRESFAFKYVNAAVFLGEEFLENLLKELRALDKTNATALRFLTWFHIITDHPISRSFLTNGLVMTNSADWQTFVQRSEASLLPRPMMTELATLPMRLFHAPTTRELKTALKSGVRPLRVEFPIEGPDFTMEELENYRASLRSQASEHHSRMERLSQLAETARYRVSMLGVGLGLLKLLHGDSAVEAFVHGAIGVVGGDAIWQYVQRRIHHSTVHHLLTIIAREPRTRQSAKN